jgi:hypothetical protein
MDVCCTWNCDPKKGSSRIHQSVQQLGCTLNDPEFKPGLGRRISLLYKTSKLALGVYPTPYLMGIRGTLPVAYSGLGMKPTTHLHVQFIVPRLRMTGGIPALPLYALMAGASTTLPLP